MNLLERYKLYKICKRNKRVNEELLKRLTPEEREQFNAKAAQSFSQMVENLLKVSENNKEKVIKTIEIDNVMVSVNLLSHESEKCEKITGSLEIRVKP